MKKLMIAAAIVCAAALSHGAALQWQLSSIPNASAGDIIADSCYWISVASMDDFNAAADKWAYVGTVETKEDGTISTGRGVLNAKGTFGDFNPGDPVKGFVVAFDAGHANYVASDFADFLTPGAGGATFAATFADASTGWKPNGAAPAPEPTSGLLLLLGVAGMALKRKRFAQSKSEVEVEQWNGKIPL